MLGCSVLALRAYAPEAHASEEIPGGPAGAVATVGGTVEQSLLAPRLADLTSGIFSAVMTRAETGVRQLSPEEVEDIDAIEGP